MKKNKINRIPLNERLNNIRSGYAGDKDYNTEAIIQFAGIPIAEYLSAFPDEYGRLLRSLRIREADARHMTYQDVAKRIDEYYQQKENHDRAWDAMETLAKPFNRCFEERNQYY